MDVKIRVMKSGDWADICRIYEEGFRTKKATFMTKVPSFEEWDLSHRADCRLIAEDEKGHVMGWCALIPIGTKRYYQGVSEIGLYIEEASRGKQVGYTLLNALIQKSEECGLWMLESWICEINQASIALHKKCGFRVVGYREKHGCDSDGIWQNTVLMEKRSKIVGC